MKLTVGGERGDGFGVVIDGQAANQAERLPAGAQAFERQAKSRVAAGQSGEEFCFAYQEILVQLAETSIHFGLKIFVRRSQYQGMNNAPPLNIENAAELVGYLRGHGHVGKDENPRITILAGGVSNRTVLVERENGAGWVLKQALEKLRVAADWFSSPARIHREALGLRWIGELTPGATPRFLFEDHGAHFLAMEAVPRPHENWKSILLRGDVAGDLVAQFGRLLGTIHRGAKGRRDELEPVFRDVSFFESLRLEPYYAYTAAQTKEAEPFLLALIAETLATRSTLVHGDFSPKNILARNGRLILLDHEVIHWGDPAFDLGFALTHFLSKAHHLREHRERFVAAAHGFWKNYDDKSCEERAVRHTLACLLARVDGRSPLEYLDADERRRQRAAALALMSALPGGMDDLIEKFIACL